MADAYGLVKAMKMAARDEREASKPVSVFFGEIQSVNPLRVNVEQKMMLGEAQLVLARNVTDYDITVTTDWETEQEREDHFHQVSIQGGDGGTALDGRTEPQSGGHTHAVAGKRQMTVHNALKAGDTVILLRQQEGQKFIVIDRIR